MGPEQLVIGFSRAFLFLRCLDPRREFRVVAMPRPWADFRSAISAMPADCRRIEKNQAARDGLKLGGVTGPPCVEGVAGIRARSAKRRVPEPEHVQHFRGPGGGDDVRL